LLSLVARVWPPSLPSRDIAGLPPWAAELIRPGRIARALHRAADQLDRALPAWTERAAEVIRQAAVRGIGPSEEHVCALLACRPLRHPDRLLLLLDPRPYDHAVHFWALTALAGTDTAAVRAAWLDELRRCADSPALAGSRAAWFAFARAAQKNWLTFRQFRDSLTSARALEAATEAGGYRAALERLGLWSDPRFAKWYRQVVYEVTSQPDASLSFAASGWIRDFPGEDYLFDALGMMERDPESWWPRHLLRWTSGVSATDPELTAKLRGFSPTTCCLLSLVRPDLSPAVAAAWPSAEHVEVIHWLTTMTAARPLDLTWVEECLRPWASLHGSDLTMAVGALCAIEPPADFLPELPERSRRGTFHTTHFGAQLQRAIANLLYVLALGDESFGVVCGEARKGRATAVRALALRPDRAEHTAPLLFLLAREGRRAARQAAEDALSLLAKQSGLTDLARLEKRVDLATAWSEEGTAGKLARVWWDVCGFHVRLAVISGEVKLHVYSGAKRLAAVPPRLRRDPGYGEIRHAREELARCYRYFRRRFEQAMVESIEYPGRDFAVLLANPVVRSLTSRLMLYVEGEPYHWTPADPLREADLPAEIRDATRVTVAHPVALHLDGVLETWQQRVVEEHLAQPFKQAFREIYLVEEGEWRKTGCERLSGRPLDARRAFALLRRRGYSPGHGDAAKVWPGGVRAHIEWARSNEDAGKMLAQVDPEFPVTSGGVWFEDGNRTPIRLEGVPPIIFSETMRDADLTVSLAPFGEMGFTPEETRRLRATLVRYLARAMGLNTVYVGQDHSHVLVEGKRAMYRIHLGSGSVLLERSRRHLHLPPELLTSADASITESTDSLTTHIISLILTLSQDDAIADPQFLGQLGVEP
jgi:hypothetical protein